MLDEVAGDGGTPGACQHQQMALAFCARAGIPGVCLGMMMFGGVPSGATERKNRDDPWFRQILNGGESALARAVRRGQRRTALYMLNNAPEIQLGGDYWQQPGNPRNKEELRAWCEEASALSGCFEGLRFSTFTCFTQLA